jgi:hypothetical protein
LNRKGRKGKPQRFLEPKKTAKPTNYYYIGSFSVINSGFVFPLRPFSSAFALKSFDFDLRPGVKHVECELV